MNLHTQLPSTDPYDAFFSVHVPPLSRGTFLKMTNFIFQNWTQIDDGVKNGTHNKIRLIFGYIELLVAAPNGKLQKMMGTLKS